LLERKKLTFVRLDDLKKTDRKNDTTRSINDELAVAKLLVFITSVVTVLLSITDKKVVHTLWPVTTTADFLWRALVA
jgi:hypothetical protein